MSGKTWIVIGSLSAAITVALGAWGAHGLESWLVEHFPADGGKRLANWKTATDYQMVHSLAMILIGVIGLVTVGNVRLTWAAIFLLIGMLLFSGMLYGWALLGQKWMAMIVPLGGLSFIIGWIMLAAAAIGLSISEK